MNSVLIVEDEPPQLEMLAEYFQMENYQAFTADNGETALEVIRNEAVDLVVSDIQMPKMNGIELVCRLNEVKPELPIILMTGYGTMEIVIEAMKNGAADFLLKPVKMEKLGATVKANLEKVIESQKQEELMPFMNGSISCNLPVNRYHLLGALTRKIGNLTVDCGYIETKRRHTVKTILYEAISNAIFHGSLGVLSEGLRDEDSDDSAYMQEILRRAKDPNFANKSIVVETVIEKEMLTIIIRDEGCGFDWKLKLSEAEDPKNLFMPYGRGLLLIKRLMGKGNYIFNKEGNQLTLLFRKGGGLHETKNIISGGRENSASETHC